MHRAVSPDAEIERLARDLGWWDRSATPVGLKVGDSCRELVMWEARGRRIHEADRLAVMQESTFRGRRVAELGSGFGCNLLALDGVAVELVGVEIEPIYVQLSPILAAISGCRAPRIVEAGADRSGLEGRAYDVVLCLGALQYMPIEAVLCEIGRILAPGGIAILILSHLGGFLAKHRTRLRSAPLRTLPRELVTVAGMLVYPWVGRAFTRPSDPVYPTQRRMRAWLSGAGLELDLRRTVIFGHETCYVAIKG